MELREPRRKKYSFSIPNNTKNNKITIVNGTFNGLSVIVENDIKFLMDLGCFGKGNLSRTYPVFTKNEPKIIRKRQMNKRKQWMDKFGKIKQLKKVIVVPDSDEETNEKDYFQNMTPIYEIDATGLTETLNLSMSEAYFLKIKLKCLDIFYLNEKLDDQKCWDLFCEADKYFVQDYICYSHFRAKNWVVRSGIKFGGDYLLYKQGPAFYHASYLVIIDVVEQETLNHKKDMCRRSMDVIKIAGLNRLCETAAKELLVLQIQWPTNLTVVTFNEMENIKVKEILMRRWIASEERAEQS